MKFLLALMCRMLGNCSSTGGSETNELAEMLTVSSLVHAVISLGRPEIRLFERSSSVITSSALVMQSTNLDFQLLPMFIFLISPLTNKLMR